METSDKERIEIAATEHSEKQHLYKGYAKMDFIAGAEYERTIADQQIEELKEQVDLQHEMARADQATIASLKELNGNLWSLWESMAECGQLSIGPQFSASYKKYKEQIENLLK